MSRKDCRSGLGASIAKNELRAHARENFDLWGMLLGYSIRVES